MRQKIYHTYDAPQPPGRLSTERLSWLSSRQARLVSRIEAQPPDATLGTEENHWLGRSYPVLAILAPVMSTHEEKIEFPGDPMCLYGALSVTVDRAVAARKTGLVEGASYNDLCPRWGEFPSTEYREKVSGSGIRQYEVRLPNTDQTVFDPRVWNDEIKQFFVNSVLMKVRPRVVMISAVSPAHRYALDIARTVRQHLPGCLIILGGRHTDETLHYDPETDLVRFEPTGTFRKIEEGAVEPLIDFAVAGQGYYALDLLMKAISLAMDIDTGAVQVPEVVRVLDEFAPHFGVIPGYSLIAALHQDVLHTFVLSGPKLDLSALPSPYQAFAIRARFPIFQTDGHVSRTAHFMVTNSCPFHCFFCSEGAAVVGMFLSFGDPGIERAIARMLDYIEYGAEAIFFDDSIFWGGNVGVIINFCRQWISIRKRAQESGDGWITVLGRRLPAGKILNLSWGAQFTVDFLASRRRPEEAELVLATMQQAGCNYLYIGIESMSESVITHVHKNLNRKEHWEVRVRRALGLARMAGIRVGSSVLFGLEGETQSTIEETIEKVEELVAEDLLTIASPNILTYHPHTAITHLHQMEDRLDYHSPNIENRPPYSYFEEAFPAVVSKHLTEEDIWRIHQQTELRWGSKRNRTPMPETIIEEE